MSFSRCSRCSRSEGVKWTLDVHGEVWEWCPDCSQQLDLLAEAPEFEEVDQVGSVSALDGTGRLVHISEVTARLLREDELPF